MIEKCPGSCDTLPGVPRRPDRFLLLGALLIVAQLGFRAWALWGSWFYFDDLAFMSRAMNQPFDVSYLTESYGGHLMPAGFALVWVLTKWWVYDWAPWAVVLLLMQAVASLGMFRLLVSMFGRRPLVLALLAGYLAWIFTLPAGIWFAAGINQLPFQIALVFGLTSHLAYLRTRRVRHLVATLLWTGFGLLFYEKTLLLFGIYALVALCWFSSGRTPERIARLWQRYRPAVIVYVILGGIYTALYAAYGLNFSPGETADVSWGPIAWNLVAIALLPGLAGGPLHWQPLTVGSFADPSDVFMLISWLAVGVLVFYAFQSRAFSKRAWSLLAFTTVGNVALLASARASVVGPEIAREYRYQTESAALAVLGIGLAFLPLLGALEPNRVREGVTPAYDSRRLVAAITTVVVALSVYSSIRYVDLWQDRNPTKAYLTAVQDSLDEAATPDQPVPLVDAGVPQTLLWSFRYPENTYSHLFKPWADQTSFPRNSVDDLYMFDDEGNLAPVRLKPAREMEPPDDPTDECDGYPLEGGGITTIPLDGPVIGGGWWIALDYDSPVATTFRLVAGDEAHAVEVPAGEHTVWFQASGTFKTVRLNSYPEDTGLCIKDLVLGSPVPDDSPDAGA